MACEKIPEGVIINCRYRAIEQLQFSKRNRRIIKIIFFYFFNNIISQIQFDNIVFKYGESALRWCHSTSYFKKRITCLTISSDWSSLARARTFFWSKSSHSTYCKKLPMVSFWLGIRARTPKKIRNHLFICVDEFSKIIHCFFFIFVDLLKFSLLRWNFQRVNCNRVIKFKKKLTKLQTKFFVDSLNSFMIFEINNYSLHFSRINKSIISTKNNFLKPSSQF